MKTQKEIEKEIERLGKCRRWCKAPWGIVYEDDELNTLLQQSKDFEEMIDECKSHSWKGHKCILVEELKQKLKGVEK